VTRRLSGLAALVAVLAVSGCAALPTSGPVHSANPQIPVGYSVDVLAEGPVEDASAQEIVEGFLRAAAYGFSDDFAVARLYLADGIDEVWDPGAQVRVYSAAKNPGLAIGTDGGLSVTIDQVAYVDREGRYTETTDSPSTSSFTLVRDGRDQWRIAALQDGLLISDLNFKQTFSASPLWFLAADYSSLVPDVRWYPLEGRATALVEGLLGGPSGWLQSAVTTAFPTATRLAGGGVRVADGLAVVDLSGHALNAEEDQRALMLAQLETTLSSIADVTGVGITVNGAAFAAGDPGQDLVLPQSVSSPVMLADGALVRWNGRELAVVAGAEDLTALEPSHPAVPFEGVSAPTVMLSGANRLVTVPTSERPSVVLVEAPDLVPPSIDRYGWIWTASAQNAGTLVVVTGDGVVGTVSAPWLAGRRVEHVRVSADGARVVVVSRTDAATRIELAAVVRDRSGMPTMTGEPLQIGESLTMVADVSWVDQSTLAVLGSQLADAANQVRLLQIGGPTTTLQLVEDAVSLTSNRNARSIVVATSDGRLYVRNGIGWREVAQSIANPAYSG